jgi:2-oxoacid:acceptor oxidoreductase delta subunit (pyruvate/2-ketoisovalerate family)
MGIFSKHEEKKPRPVKVVKKVEIKKVSKLPKPAQKPLQKTVQKIEQQKRVGIKNENEFIYDAKKVPVMKNVTESKTRTYRPQIDIKKCQKTYNCFLFCPRNAIMINAEGMPVINYTLCDGCLICLRECPAVAIVEERE